MNNRAYLIVGGIGAFFVLMIVGFLIAYASAANSANRYEADIEASHKQALNVLGQYAPMLREAVGVTKLQAGAVESVITGANESRYGKTGSSATVQWIQEQNPTLDQSNYKRIIDLVESGRHDFRDAQRDKIDKINQYKIALGQMPGSYFMRLAGYPTSEYRSKNYDKIVVSGHADEAFATGRDDGVNLNTL